MAEFDLFKTIGNVWDVLTKGSEAFKPYMNYELQRKAYEDQAALNKLQIDREDNAFQRRAIDLKKAGYSKNYASGSGSPTTALHVGNVPQMESYLAPTLENIGIQKANADVEVANNQVLVTERQAEKLKEEIKKVKSDTIGKNIENAIQNHDRKIIQNSGMPSKATTIIASKKGAFDLFKSVYNKANQKMNDWTLEKVQAANRLKNKSFQKTKASRSW